MPWNIDDGAGTGCYDFKCITAHHEGHATGLDPLWTVATAYEFYAYAVRASKCAKKTGQGQELH